MAILIEPWRIPEEGQDVEGEEPAEVLSLEPGCHIETEGPLRYALHIQYVSHELIVTGKLSCRVRFECARCADPVPLEIKETAFFAERAAENVHDTVDLTDEVRESIILAFPSYPLCQPACRGLCVQCGVNLNKERCGCSQPAKERWTAFGGLDKIEVKNGRTQKEKIKK
jgi:uncharacterized protein